MLSNWFLKAGLILLANPSHDDTSIIPDDEIKEYLQIFAKTINLDQVPNYLWDLKMVKKGDHYILDFYFDSNLEFYWVVIPNKLKIITIEVLEILNEQSEKIFREDWMYGIKDQPALEAILGQVDNGYFGIIPYPTISSKAAFLWYEIATKQAFRNGNKRTALLTALYYLKINGYYFDIKSADQLYDVSLKVANREMSREQLLNYVLEHSLVDFEYPETILNKSDLNDLKQKIDLNE